MDKRIYLKVVIAVFGVIFLILLAIIARKAYIYSNQAILSQKVASQSAETFSDLRKYRETLPQRKETGSMIAVGDISYSRGVERMVKKNKDINFPFLKVKDYFQSADIVFGNLETPITAGREIMDNEMVFRSDPETANALKEAGVDIVSLANNHSSDFGNIGVIDTINYLTHAGVNFVGAGKNINEAYNPLFMEQKGLKFAYLAYGDQNLVPATYEAGESRAGSAFMRTEIMTEEVRQAKQKADFVIVSMHAGIEYVPTPSDFQINFAHAAIDAGADLVIGHHPHVVQTMENYKGKYIFYSLGNFVFDQMWSRETRESLSVKIYFTKDGIKKSSFLPFIIENFSQPRPANENEAEKILQRLKYPLATQIAYFWNTDKKIFEKTKRSSLYTGLQTGKSYISKKSEADLDNDATFESYILEKGILTVTENSRQIWQSPKEWWVDDFVLADIDDDGKNDLVVVEGSYSHADKCKDTHVAVWLWNDWGFTNLWRSEKGNYCNLEVETIEGKKYIIVDTY